MHGVAMPRKEEYSSVPLCVAAKLVAMYCVPMYRQTETHMRLLMRGCTYMHAVARLAKLAQMNLATIADCAVSEWPVMVQL
eukprot:CAMPEP_0204112866 /NCGR_PEP_ID=MMETSP0361-20130328/3312_1 /ASSEMBLY_ACC=CAM_ASM_000343 /TAXON_ID=268821 /ORGANISM="Scrippsiella Hangoei, Strain SHTV-5" /LENGTH=80 /DNA_ID=CAMNT_0051063137 /DNA_START=48 /DNA_END=290 /DNA_ORIENTATION=+